MGRFRKLSIFRREGEPWTWDRPWFSGRLCCQVSSRIPWILSKTSIVAIVILDYFSLTFYLACFFSETLVEIDEKGNVLNVYWHGILNDGTAFQSSPLPLTKNEEDNTGLGFEAIGTVAQGHWVPKEHETPHETKWWTKAHLDDRSTLLTTARGYEVHNCLVDWTNK